MKTIKKRKKRYTEYLWYNFVDDRVAAYPIKEFAEIYMILKHNFCYIGRI